MIHERAIARSMSRTRNIALVVALCGFEMGAIALLHQLGNSRWMTVPWGSVRSWLEIAPIEDVVAAGLRSIALAVAYWIAASTAAYGAARISRVPRLIQATTRTTLPPIRTAVDRAIAVAATAAAFASPIAPAVAEEIPAPPEPVVYQISDGGVPTPVNPPIADHTVILPPGVGGAGYTPRPAGGATIGEGAEATEHAGAIYEATSDASSSHEVVVGDNLWTISAAHLHAVYTDGAVDTGEIAAYWRRVIEANTPNLRSGNPNLIYSGEEIVLPDPGKRGDT
jgi:hypothetical protein